MGRSRGESYHDEEENTTGTAQGRHFRPHLASRLRVWSWTSSAAVEWRGVFTRLPCERLHARAPGTHMHTGESMIQALQARLLARATLEDTLSSDKVNIVLGSDKANIVLGQSEQYTAK